MERATKKLTLVGGMAQEILNNLPTNSLPASEQIQLVDCETCGDTGMEIVGGYGARFCKCRLAQIRANRLSKIPPKFALFHLSTLEPKPSAHREQVTMIPFIKENPERSYLLAGRFGSGKSLMMWMLYRNAIKQTDRKVVVCTLAELLAEFRAFIQSSKDNETPKLPSLCAAELRQKERPYSIFLDDIDKARPTEYAAEQFFEIVNAIYEYQHQLVVTTNLRVQELSQHFDRADERFGGAIVRRLVDNAKVVEMF
jgi:DNA replication protein DnaC